MKKIHNFQEEVTGFKNENKRRVYYLNSQRYQADILVLYNGVAHRIKH